MFNVNDMIIYGSHGICKIEGIEEKVISRVKKKYFVLKPITNESSTYFVPVDNENLIGKMRRILSKEEIEQLIDSMANEDANWIDDEKERKEQYKIILSEGNHTELIKMIKAIFFEKKNREENKKRLLASDEHFLKDAEQLLYGEFQYVLNLSPDQLMSYIFERIEGSTK